MKISQVCIDRPVLATVMSLVIALVGIISMTRLQNRELPAIDPPVIAVTTVFPGAAPEVVETSVTDVLEDQLNGISGVKHVTSISREQVSQITVEFDIDRDLEAAANDVRDRVARVRNRLPDEIDEPVVAKRDSDSNAVMWIALSGAAYDQVQLTQIAETRIIDRLSKLPGVSTVFIGGERRFSMRVWIDNHRLSGQNLTIAEIADALRRENVEIPSGRLESSDTEFTVRSLGEMKTVEEYQDMIVASQGNQLVRLKDVARVEVGPEDVRKLVRFNGTPAIGLGVVKQSTANTLDVAEAVKAEVGVLVGEMPPGVALEIAFDSSIFIRRSISDVTKTIFEASLLVVLVIYIFLRSFRATLIPAVAIPVSILGALAVLYLLGFTINTLTLMGVTLAIGLVVDDAIVVLENVTRWLEQGATPAEAASKGMAEISFAVVAATVSAVAVFLPLTFLTDTTGRLFREFAVTVAAALAVSGFVAVTLSPALCALVLRPTQRESGLKARLARMFDGLQNAYGALLRKVLSFPLLYVAIGVAWLALGVVLYPYVDQELIPGSDRSVIFVFTEGPEGATVEYMDRYQRQAEVILESQPEVERVFSVVALGIGTPGLVNKGIVIAMLTDPDERERDQEEVVEALRPQLAQVAGIKALPAGATMLSGFSSSPVSLVIQGEDLGEIARFTHEIMRRMRDTDSFGNIVTNLYLNKPQLEVEIDRNRANDLGASVREVATTLQIMLGGLDLSTFKLGGETYKVMVQLDRAGRDDPRDLLFLTVRGRGQLISLSSLVETRESIAPREIPHNERQRAALISTNLLPGVAQGEAMESAWAIAQDVLPDEGFQVLFSGDAEKFLESGNALTFAYLLALVAVYLVLAAQFESFVHPVTILVAVAFSFTGALVALKLTDMFVQPTTLNLFSKIGLVMLIGLVTKNSILIVEFANQLRERGHSVREAVQQASNARFRPILMTALATLVGILPIALGAGAGGDSRAPLGIAVVGGMFFSTALTFFIVPATYLIIETARERSRRRTVAPASEPAAVAGGR